MNFRSLVFTHKASASGKGHVSCSISVHDSMRETGLRR